MLKKKIYTFLTMLARFLLVQGGLVVHTVCLSLFFLTKYYQFGLTRNHTTPIVLAGFPLEYSPLRSVEICFLRYRVSWWSLKSDGLCQSREFITCRLSAFSTQLSSLSPSAWVRSVAWHKHLCVSQREKSDEVVPTSGGHPRTWCFVTPVP